MRERFARDGKFADKDEEQDDFGISDCCQPCLTLFKVDVSAEEPAYAPMRLDAFSRVLIPLAFLVFCAYYWPTLLKNA